MKDQRLNVFRTAVDALVESLDAAVRVSRWTAADPPPEPLTVSASKLAERLAAANRLANGTFVGTPVDTVKVTAMCTAMKRLDAAYVAYRAQIGSAPEQAVDAAATLELEISEAMAPADSWR